MKSKYWKESHKTIKRYFLDYLLGIQYWRDRAQLLEQDIFKHDVIRQLIVENDNLRKRNRVLDILACDYFFQSRDLESYLLTIIEKLKK